MSPDQALRQPVLPRELRVHGVGGPQAAKMLGEVHEHEVVTMPPFEAAPGCGIPQDTTTRFARRLRDGGKPAPVGRTEAYEWGALTVATAGKALWVLYLPFTLLNAAGWAHAPVRGRRNARLVAWHRGFVHVASLLVTLTYVGWLGYLSLDLVARTWVDHVGTTGAEGIDHDFVIFWVPRLAPAVFVVVVILLLLAPALNNFERVRDGTSPTVPRRWPAEIRISSPAFFAQAPSYHRRRILHLGVALVATLVLLVRYVLGWHRIGLMLLVLAAVQAVLVLLLSIVDLWARRRVRPSELDGGALLLEASLDDDGARLPAGATFVSMGFCLAHAAFAGLAMTLSPLLARWPSGGDDTSLPVRAELGAADVLAWDILLLVVLLSVVLWRSKGESDASPAGVVERQPAAVRLARRVPMLGAATLVAFSVPVAFYGVLNIRAIARLDGSVFEAVSEWYDTYDVKSGVAKQVGAFVLVALPSLFYGVLRRPHASGVGRVIGNIWDVLTFWPRRFHPLAVPCSAERSVPELRARIRHVRARQPLVVVAHSQGSVLSAAAISSLDPAEPAPGLVTFGSPLGTLYAPTWPAYVPSLLVDTSDRVAAGGAPPWVNFWRVTDPVGAAVPKADNHQLHEPQALPVDALAAIAALRPLERPPRWGTIAGHSHYLAEPEVQEEITARRGP